jgi:hypothetical protein
VWVAPAVASLASPANRALSLLAWLQAEAQAVTLQLATACGLPSRDDLSAQHAPEVMACLSEVCIGRTPAPTLFDERGGMSAQHTERNEDQWSERAHLNDESGGANDGNVCWDLWTMVERDVWGPPTIMGLPVWQMLPPTNVHRMIPRVSVSTD